jgi:hypothetical protein
MIEGLHETQVDVEDLERSIDLYMKVMGLDHPHTEPERGIASARATATSVTGGGYRRGSCGSKLA